MVDYRVIIVEYAELNLSLEKRKLLLSLGNGYERNRCIESNVQDGVSQMRISPVDFLIVAAEQDWVIQCRNRKSNPIKLTGKYRVKEISNISRKLYSI